MYWTKAAQITSFFLNPPRKRKRKENMPTPDPIPNQNIALLEAFQIGEGGSEPGIGRITAEALADMPEFTQVIILTGAKNPPVPLKTKTITIPDKPAWLKLAYKIGNQAGPAKKTWNQIAYTLGYWHWLRQASAKAKEIHAETPITFALHATWTNLAIGSLLGKTGIRKVASLGSTGGRMWEVVLAHSQRKGRGTLLALNSLTKQKLGGIETNAPIEIPKNTPIPKEKTGVLFIDHPGPRKNAKTVLEALRTPIVNTKVTVLTFRPEMWERSATKVLARLPHKEYLAELAKHEFLLIASDREGAPTSALEGLHLKTIPIATTLTWAKSLKIVGFPTKPNPQEIRAALKNATLLTNLEKESMRVDNLKWAQKNTGTNALKATIRVAMSQL